MTLDRRMLDASGRSVNKLQAKVTEMKASDSARLVIEPIYYTYIHTYIHTCVNYSSTTATAVSTIVCYPIYCIAIQWLLHSSYVKIILVYSHTHIYIHTYTHTYTLDFKPCITGEGVCGAGGRADHPERWQQLQQQYDHMLNTNLYIHTYIHTYLLSNCSQFIKLSNPNRTSTPLDLHSFNYKYIHTYICCSRIIFT